MTLQDEMDSKQNWTQEEINALKYKHRRTHFDHFHGLELKPQRRKKIGGVWHVWKFGKWRKDASRCADRKL